MSTLPILRRLKGKVDDEVANVIELLGKGVKDVHDGLIALNTKHNTLASTVTTVSATATAAQTQATSAVSASQQPVAAGQVNYQSAATAPYSLQQSDHMGAVQLSGTTALTITLSSLVTAPFRTRIINQSTQTATLALDSSARGSLLGSSSLAANASAEVFYDGTNWLVG